MPSESSAGGPPPPFPPELGPDRAAFRISLEREVAHRPHGDPIRLVLQDPRTLASWDRYACLVYAYSARLSLVARGDRSRIYTRHILDSLNPLGILIPAPTSLLDVGSGAGFPGIPLAIAWSETRVTLLESRGKKVGFLERVIRELPLVGAAAIPARLEEYGRGLRAEPVEAITIRAVAGLPSLLRQAAPVARPGARWVYFVGSGERAEKVLASLEASHLPAVVKPGLFGGTLLVGTFDRRA
jgi:16S rRNA (guanine(527)-N(7))-methyltransferase RsmG